MFISRKNLRNPLNLLEYIIKFLLQYGKVTITDIREKTTYQFSSNEVSAALKRLRKIGLVSYKGRVWYLNETLLKSMGLLALQEILNYVTKKQ
jgi:predicted transcriptional regulator